MKSSVAETVAMLRTSISGSVDLTLEPTTTGLVAGAHLQLLQVVVNLIRNAGEAVRPPDQIQVSAAFCRADTPVILSHGKLVAGDYARITVCDTGVGMGKATLALIFAPFFTTRDAGTGLGLATVQAIVGDHGGSINVESTPGTGSVFTVFLPALPQTAVLLARHGQGHGQGCGETVLVHGPNLATFMQFEKMLAALGFEPVGLSMFEDALAASPASPSRLDAMLIEATLPNVGALQAACGCRAVAGTPVGADRWTQRPACCRRIPDPSATAALDVA